MKQTVIEAIEVHKKLLAEYEKTCVEKVTAAAEMIISSIKAGGCIYICGNGGSAADAQHIAGEFIGRFKRERKALPAAALSTDTSTLTSIGNDYGFDDIFKRQVEGLAKKGDVLWALTCSGTSKNVIAAAKLAKEMGCKILSFTGKPKTPIEELSDICISIDAPDTASAQEIHQLAYHTICDLVEASLCKR
ncbi:MAG: SIS domain-containing protein [Sedimentisphaerales bacterium]|nr:SIS domain-containing protein [Sedimentisphaerales bacterium]